MATLVVLGPPAPGVRHRVPRSGNTVIGRDESCEIVLVKRTVSRRHAQIIGQGGDFYIEDLGSSNGTFVNTRRIQSRTVLRDGDNVSIHDIPLAFYLADDGVKGDPGQQTVTNAVTGNGQEVPPKPPDKIPAKLAPEVVMPGYSGAPGAAILRGQLDTLIEITRSLGSSLDVKEILPRVLDLLFKMFPQATLGEIHLRGPDGQLIPVAMKHGKDADSTLLTQLPFNSKLTQEVLESGQGILKAIDTSNGQSVLEDAFQSLICVPITGATSRGMGVILLESDDIAHPFLPDDLQLVSAVAVLAGQAISYSRAHLIVIDHERTERQLQMAREIQMGMLSGFRPDIRGYEFFDYYSAAEAVGGDYYFYDHLKDGRVVIGVADASGKGLPAAMKISRFAGEVRYRIATSTTLKAALSGLNEFVADFGEAVFITLCLCIVDPSRHSVTVASAGHMPPLCRRRATGTVEEFVVPRGSFPLGVERGTDFHPAMFKLQPGDQIVLYTDGVSEAMNPESQLYGIPRLKDVVVRTSGGISAQVEAISADVNAFRRGRSASDDTCIVAFGRTDRPS